MGAIDNFLNRITMYRLVLYYLIFLFCIAAAFSLYGVFYFGFIQLAISSFLIITICYFANIAFAKIFRADVNVESSAITGLILSLIFLPQDYWITIPLSLIAIGSKFVLALYRKHIFNPAAIGVVAAFYLFGQGASWWVGNIWMLPFVVIGGFLVVRKIQKELMVSVFLLVMVGMAMLQSLIFDVDLTSILSQSFLYSSTIFFAFIMLTEPSTSPHTHKLRLIYAALVGILVSPFIHFGDFYFTPELALLVGNIFTFVVSPKRKLQLIFKERNQIAQNTYDFVFESDYIPKYKPGQYLEWTLSHNSPDLRGNRRYFTIASSPTENNIRIGVKFYDKPSTFKQRLLSLEKGSKASADQLSGDFVLPDEPSQKAVFIAGGIGITPFRSMIKYLLDKNQKRDITLFYSNTTKDSIAYSDLLKSASDNLGIKTVYTLTDEKDPNWDGETGFVNKDMIVKHVPDYKTHNFYISGTHQMVVAMESLLKSLGIPKKQIKVDFFPGYA
jgi:ferredoxin-NADP reductase/Na+-translocating ferredoxin:NAD+ oxidoreductase RnfD subunit